MSEMKTILVTGCQGQLGQSIQTISSDYPDIQFVFVSRQQLDLSLPQQIDDFFQQNYFDVIVNCAAYTAVDKAETEQESASQINHLAVKQLAEHAQQQQAKLIHISTDYVFDGKQYRPYIETDAVSPQGIYGESKLAGELAIQAVMPKNALIIRTSWVYSPFGNNFVKTMLRLGQERNSLTVVFDQIGTPTYAMDLAEVILTIVASPTFNLPQFETTVFHYSNEGVCSWYDFAKTIFEEAHIRCQVGPVETKDYPTPAKRPHYSVLNKAKIKQQFNIAIPYWKESLQQCLHELQERKA